MTQIFEQVQKAEPEQKDHVRRLTNCKELNGDLEEWLMENVLLHTERGEELRKERSILKKSKEEIDPSRVNKFMNFLNKSK
mmetsp:Transcript_1138/g.2086  ORF Transcript_1138/g.2086 Transcript_1138/m.2086 type:complete len:81 (-) Transcript_1138:155-397(-)